MKSDLFDPPHKDVRTHAASGFVFSGAAQMTKILVQLASVVVMARLLAPADFGLVAMVGPVYAFALLFCDLGLSQATLQRPNLTAAQVNTFFWFNVAVGSTITLILTAVSPLVGWFYGEPRTIGLTIAMATLVGISGLGNQHGALMLRRMAFRTQATINIVSSILGLIGSIIWGVLFHSYWALFFGMAVTTLSATAGAGRPGPRQRERCCATALASPAPIS